VGERRLLEQADLTPQEWRLCEAAEEGRLLDLPCRQIRAQVLFQLLTGQGPELVATVVAVRLRGAAIVGRLDLNGLTLRCPLELYDCDLGDRLNLVKAEAPDISLRGSRLRHDAANRNCPELLTETAHPERSPE
jgi:hypothetical protein